MKDYILKNGISSNPRNIKVIPNWYDANQIDNTQIHNEEFRLIRDRYEKIFLYSGNMGQLQDMETILEAVKNLKNNEEIFTIFCGHGKKQTMVKEFIENNNIKNAVVYDFLKGTDYSDVLNIADCCYVSLVKEGVGLGVPSKTYGYLAAHKPLIAIMNEDSDIVKEIKQYDAGIQVDNNDLKSLIEFILNKNRSDFKIMGDKAFKIYLDNYTRKINTDKYYDLLK